MDQGKELFAICISYHTRRSMQCRKLKGGGEIFHPFCTDRLVHIHYFFLHCLDKLCTKISHKVSNHYPSTKYLNQFSGVIFLNFKKIKCMSNMKKHRKVAYSILWPFPKALPSHTLPPAPTQSKMWWLHNSHFMKWFFPEHSGLSGGREILPK